MGNSIIRTVDILANCMIVGVPVWVFFLQSPLLFQFMGRDKFLSPMMRLTNLMFRWTLPICAAVSVLCSLILRDTATTSGDIELYSSLVSFVSVVINAVVVVPKALQAGKRATRTANNSQSATDFAVDGGHQTDTRTLHQTVVVFVVFMLGGAVTHVHFVVN
uniref:TMEM205-like domain-containing protein n=2 Tax=Ditylum brightwellii TaxID=49249 RepID=A0A7S2A123_9STRA|mmetsp:Transcript_6379/g.9671  ORF Transcript_6379/g.9671 Transcript_6379/m.9671 type:complete len:162 (+) Transcript_6379:1-486(+)